MTDLGGGWVVIIALSEGDVNKQCHFLLAQPTLCSSLPLDSLPNLII